MANALTGEFDAVVEVRVQAVNRILATLHQNGASKDIWPSFPHSVAVRVGKISKLVLSELASWAAVFVVSGGEGVQKKSSSKFPPGVSSVADQAIADMANESIAQVHTPGVVRGTAHVQISTPSITFPQGSTSEVIAHVQLRAHYTPDPDTRPLPEPIHGEVRATLLVEPGPSGTGKTALEVTPTADDSKIVFLPAAGTGLTAADADAISEQVRIALRDRFEPMNVELPEDFQFLRFKALGSGASQVIALPLNLSGPTPPPSALAGVTNVFLAAADHFAVAISKEYVESLLQPLKDQLQAFHMTFKVSFWIVYILIPVKHTVSYNVTVSSVKLTWQPGSIKLTVKGSAVTSSILPNYNFTVEQTLTLTLNAATETISVAAVGDPSISGLPGLAVGKAMSEIKAARDQALQGAQSFVQQALKGDVTLGGALKSFDTSASATYTSLQIQTDGVVLGGTLSVKGRSLAVVHFTETSDETALTAFKSWIPAGTVERYVWSWLTKKSDIIYPPWKAIEYHEVADEHRFILKKPSDLPAEAEVCLRIEGSRVRSSGPLGVDSAFGGEDTSACQVGGGDDLVFTMPSWWDTLMAVPVWLPDPPPDAELESAIVAHVNAVNQSRASGAPGANSIVHFAGAQSGKAVETLSRILHQSRHGDAAIAMVVVLPCGSFRQTGSAIEERLGSLASEFPGSLAITEDYEDGWTRTFGVEGTPATYLMDANGDLVWQQAGALNAASFVGALDRHLIAGPRPRSRTLRPAMQPGDRAPDVLFQYASGGRMALRKLRGRRVLLTFWKSWSAPCLKELRRLESMHTRAGRGEAFILAVNDGEDPQRVAEIYREHHLTFAVIADPHRQIARRYRVTCWPTTVSIDENGVVNRVHLGTTPDR